MDPRPSLKIQTFGCQKYYFVSMCHLLRCENIFQLYNAFLIKFSRMSELKCAIRKIIFEFGMHQVLSIQRPFNDIGLRGELT